MRSVGSCHDALAACEDDEQANEASPAFLMFIAPTQSAGAEKPHSTHTKLLWVLRFCAVVWRHSGHWRLVFWGGTGATSRTAHLPLLFTVRQQLELERLPTYHAAIMIWSMSHFKEFGTVDTASLQCMSIWS